jgi:hypothetical protein
MNIDVIDSSMTFIDEAVYQPLSIIIANDHIDEKGANSISLFQLGKEACHSHREPAVSRNIKDCQI